jgi:hypothetical protein
MSSNDHDLFTLYYAIMANSEALVKSYLESGQDPDIDLSPAIMNMDAITTIGMINT